MGLVLRRRNGTENNTTIISLMTVAQTTWTGQKTHFTSSSAGQKDLLFISFFPLRTIKDWNNLLLLLDQDLAPGHSLITLHLRLLAQMFYLS